MKGVVIMSYVYSDDFALLVFFGIFIINILFAVACYMMNGKYAAIGLGVIVFVGLWIALGIINLCEFGDATPETIITMDIWFVLPSSVCTFFEFLFWLQKHKLEKLRQKENTYREEIARLEQEISDRKTIFHLIQLIECCGCETVYFENHRELLDMNCITNDINMKKAQLKDISSKIMVVESKVYKNPKR